MVELEFQSSQKERIDISSNLRILILYKNTIMSCGKKGFEFQSHGIGFFENMKCCIVFF